MDNVIRGIFSDDESMASKQAEYLEIVNQHYTQTWNYYQLDDIIYNCLKTGIFHNTDNKTDKDIKALEYLEIFNTDGKTALQEYWDSEFSSIIPGEDENVSDISEWRFQYFWDYYKMDDVKDGIYHGKVTDYTEKMREYVANMENDVENNPERQGCVAVTRELAEILDTLIAREIFEDVQNGWLKFCFYYNILGTDAD